MKTFIKLLALVGIGAVAGFINVLSAGGSMLTLPLLMFLGLPPRGVPLAPRLAALSGGANPTSGMTPVGTVTIAVRAAYSPFDVTRRTSGPVESIRRTRVLSLIG